MTKRNELTITLHWPRGHKSITGTPAQIGKLLAEALGEPNVVISATIKYIVRD